MLDPEFENGLTHASHRALYRYWIGKTDAAGIALTRDFDLNDIPKLAPAIGMVQVVREASRLRFRHAYTGKEIVNKLRHDPTNLWFEEAYSGDYLGEAHVTYVEVAALKKPLFSQREYPVKRDKILVYDRLILPLAGNDGLIDNILYQPVFLGLRRARANSLHSRQSGGGMRNGKSLSVAA